MGVMDAVKLPGQLKKLQDMQSALAKKQVVVEEDGIRIVMSGDQKVLEFSIQGISNDLVVQKLNKAIMLSQQMAAEEMKSMMGGLGGLANMLGGGGGGNQ